MQPAGADGAAAPGGVSLLRGRGRGPGHRRPAHRQGVHHRGPPGRSSEKQQRLLLQVGSLNLGVFLHHPSGDFTVSVRSCEYGWTSDANPLYHQIDYTL